MYRLIWAYKCAPSPITIYIIIYGVIILGANTLYINFCLFKQIPMASKRYNVPKVSLFTIAHEHRLYLARGLLLVCFEGLGSGSHRVFSRFVRGSREISPASSLYRESIDSRKIAPFGPLGLLAPARQLYSSQQ